MADRSGQLSNLTWLHLFKFLEVHKKTVLIFLNKLFPHRGERMKHSWGALLLASSVFFILPATMAGCGKKGRPLPPEGLVPEAVKSIKAKGLEGSLFISWEMPQKNSDGSKLVDLAGFKLYKKSGNEECRECPSESYPLYVDIDLEAPGSAMIEGKTVTFADTELKEGKHYSYKVAPYNKSGYYGAFSKRLHILWQNAPPPPKELEGSVSDRAAILKWKAIEETVRESFSGYNIYRSEISGSYPPSAVNKAPVQQESFTDIGLENNQQYHYIVRSVIRAGDTVIESKPSREIILVPVDTVPPPPPKRLTVVLSEAGTRLFWESEITSDILGYNIYRRKKGQIAADKINETPVEGTTFIDFGVVGGESYYYSITAVDNSLQRNESTPSEEIAIKVPK